MLAEQFADVFMYGAWLTRQVTKGYAPLCARRWLEGCHERCAGCGRYLEPTDRLSLAREHLAKRITIGASPLRQEAARWGCLDVDQGHLSPMVQADLVVALRHRLRHFLPAVLTEFSGKKGYHLWVLLDSPVPAAAIKGFLGHVVATVGADDGFDTAAVEVFPKQATGRGNVVKLPLSIHRGSNRFCALLDDGFSPLKVDELPLASGSEFLSLAESERWQSTEPEAPAAPSGRADMPLIPGDPRILCRCQVIHDVWRQQARDASRVDYDTWFRWVVLPLVHFEQGEDLIHAISAVYPRYDAAKTQETIEELRRRRYSPPACLQAGRAVCPADRHPSQCGLEYRGRSPSPLRFALAGDAAAAALNR